MIIEKLRFQSVFRPIENVKADVFKFLRFEERFRDGLVWTVGLTEEIKLRFQISPV